MANQPFSPDSFETFGDLLRYLRRRERLTQLELSITVGYSEAQIGRLEKNQRRPDLTALRALFIPALHMENEPELIARFLKLAESARREDAPAPGIPPYKGLLFFDESDAELFFGREALTAHLVQRAADLAIDSSLRFLAVVGASGSGKSSLVRAGLAVALKRAGWDVRIFTPGASPRKALESQLELIPAVAERLLILIDQFEETFTLCHDEALRSSFIEKLLGLAREPSGRATITIALRADFYSHCAQYPLLRQAVAGEQEYIGQMTTEDLRRAIEEPARRGGWEFEPGLVDMLLNDIGAHGTSEPEPGALPLLSHALLTTWERRRGRMFTLEGYRASGGVRGAIAETAESVFTDQLNQTQQRLARDVFLRLTELGEGTEDTRRRATLKELVRESQEATQLRTVLNTLAEARLITLNEDSAEVAHEALIREWQRLHEWLTQDREGLLLHRHLTESAQGWETREHDPSELYRGARLAGVREWAAANEERLNAAELAFLTASVDQEQHDALEREAQRQRELEAAQKLAETQSRAAMQLRKRAVYLAGVLALAIIAALTAGFFANRNATNLIHSEAQRLAAEANSLILNNGDTNLIALLAIRSLNMQYTPSGDAVLASAILMGFAPREFTGHTNGLLIGGVAFSPDGRYLASASEDKTARIWDVASGETIHILSGHTDAVGGVAFSPDGKYVVTGSRDRTARLWHVSTGEMVRTFVGHADSIEFGPVFSPDGKYVLTGSLDQTTRLWDVATGQTVRIFVGHNNAIFGVAFSPDGKYIGTTSLDKTARLWDVTTGEQVQILRGHEDALAFIRFSLDGSLVATGSDDHTIRLWNTASGQLVRILEGHQNPLEALAFSPDGQYLLSGSQDRTARLWDLATGQTVHVFAHPTRVGAVAFSPDGKYIATGDSKSVKLWNLQATLSGTQLVGHANAVGFASFSPDGKYIVTASDDQTARLWDATTGQELRQFIGHTDSVKSAIFSPDGKTILTTSWDQTVRLWEAATGQLLLTFAGHTDPVYRAAFSLDGSYLVTTSYDGTARVWDTHTSQTMLTYNNQGPEHINRIVFSPDGKTVATSGDDGTARIWDPLTGEELRVFEGHTDIVTGIAFSPDGKYLATGSYDGIVRLWDITSEAEVRRFTGHTGSVFSTVFSPDGQYVLSSGADATVRLWDVQTGEEVRRFTGHTNEVRNVTFSPDGKFILTASNDGTARLWLLDLQETIRAVCSRLIRDLTPEERIQFDISDECPTCPAQ